MKAATFVSLFSMACGGGGFGIMVGNGKLVSASREVGSFKDVDFSSALVGEVIVGDGPSVSVKVDENLLAFINAQVVEGELRLFVDPGIHIEPSEVFISVHLPALEQMEASGASRVNVSGPAQRFEVSGASEVHANNLDVEALAVDVSGAGKLVLAGRTSSFDLEVSGASHLEAAELSATSATVDVSGASHATITASGTVGGEVSGASTLTFTTQPQSTAGLDISGASSVNYP